MLCDFLEDTGIPNRMQVILALLPPDPDLRCTSCDIFVVQRLMQVPDEVDQEFKRPLALYPRQGSVTRPVSVVGQRADNTPSLLAVPRIVDLARAAGRVVVGIDEVEVAGIFPYLQAPDLIRPRGYFGEVVVALVT